MAPRDPVIKTKEAFQGETSHSHEHAVLRSMRLRQEAGKTEAGKAAWHTPHTSALCTEQPPLKEGQ